MKCLRRLLPELIGRRENSSETLEKLIITMSDFENAIKEVTPSAMRENLEPPDVPWSEIGGLRRYKTRTTRGSRMAHAFSRHV